MLVVYEYAACLLVALCSGTLLFTVSAMGLMLWTAGSITWRNSREMTVIPNRLLTSRTADVRMS